MDTPPTLPEQRIKDTEHLMLLRVGHYIVGGFSILFGSLFLIHVFFGVAMLANPKFLEETTHSARLEQASPSSETDAASADSSTGVASPAAETPVRRSGVHRRMNQPDMPFPPAFFGYMMAGMGGFAVLSGWTCGLCNIYSGFCIKRRRKRVFSLVIAGIDCMFFPLGTALGVFTFIVLLRPSVVSLYDLPSLAPLAGP